MVLERAREDALARPRTRPSAIVSPSNPVTFQPANVNETACERSIRSPRCGLEPHAPASSASGTRVTSSTSFVRVSRSARNHSPHPVAVLPPLALHARDVVAEVHVVGQLTQRRRARTAASSPHRSTRTRRPAAGRRRGTREETTSMTLNCTLSNAVPESATNLHRCRALVNLPPAELAPPNGRSRCSTPLQRRRARHERDRAANGHDAEHGLAPARHARGLRSRRAGRGLRAATGSASASSTSRTPCSRASTSARSRGRTSWRSSRRRARRRRCRSRATRTRSPSTSCPGAHQVQPVSRLGRPSIAHATSAGKVMLAFSGRELPDGPFRAYTTAHDHRPRGARARDRDGPRARLRAGDRRARARPHRDRRADPLRAAASSRRSSRSRARARASTPTPSRAALPLAPRASGRDLARARLDGA